MGFFSSYTWFRGQALCKEMQIQQHQGISWTYLVFTCWSLWCRKFFWLFFFPFQCQSYCRVVFSFSFYQSVVCSLLLLLLFWRNLSLNSYFVLKSKSWLNVGGCFFFEVSHFSHCEVFLGGGHALNTSSKQLSSNYIATVEQSTICFYSPG